MHDDNSEVKNISPDNSCDNSENKPEGPGKDFIRAIIEADCKNGRFDSRVHTRFPPEPNGYLHIGHAKSICLNFGVAKEYNGKCNLRFDDTNPLKESTEYVDSIKTDVRWLGFDWEDREFYSSDYFEKLYGFAEQLIKADKAYVDSLSADEIRAHRGNLTEAGKDSPYRGRSIEENLDLFRRMRAGEFDEGQHVLRAKIDMSSPNMVMRDPTLYRIRKVHHHRSGDAWCIYPMYDFTHCISDSLEGITHSLCSLEFENNRELYDWLLIALGLYRPQQTEFARLKITRTVLSKRKLIQLVREGHVVGWDDPRLPTLSGMRRRGYTPEAIREFCSRIGVSRAESTVEFGMLEFCVREHLNRVAPRLMAVINPVKVVIENYPEDQVEWFEMPLNPEDESQGSRKVPFSRELWIEEEDFMQNPPSKFFRLAPGREVRLRYAYYITCKDVLLDANGKIKEIICSYDPESKGGGTPDGRKVKGTLHWVSAKMCKEAEVRLYDHLFTQDDPENVPEGQTFIDSLNPDSLCLATAKIEPALMDIATGGKVQFERLGYFCKDQDSLPDKPIFNRTATLKDTWGKIAARQ